MDRKSSSEVDDIFDEFGESLFSYGPEKGWRVYRFLEFSMTSFPPDISYAEKSMKDFPSFKKALAYIFSIWGRYPEDTTWAVVPVIGWQGRYLYSIESGNLIEYTPKDSPVLSSGF